MRIQVVNNKNDFVTKRVEIKKKIKALGIQGHSGDKIRINDSSYISLDKFGLYEIEANKYFFIDAIHIESDYIHGDYLIIDYEEGEI